MHFKIGDLVTSNDCLWKEAGEVIGIYDEMLWVRKKDENTYGTSYSVVHSNEVLFFNPKPSASTFETPITRREIELMMKVATAGALYSYSLNNPHIFKDMGRLREAEHDLERYRKEHGIKCP